MKVQTALHEWKRCEHFFLRTHTPGNFVQNWSTPENIYLRVFTEWYFMMLPNLTVSTLEVSPKASEQHRHNISLESGSVSSLNLIWGPLGIQAVISVRKETLSIWQAWNIADKYIAKEGLQENLNQGIAEGMEQIETLSFPRSKTAVYLLKITMKMLISECSRRTWNATEDVPADLLSMAEIP